MSKIQFKKVAFIGMGLIASSMARSMRELGIADRIVTSVRSEETIKIALELGLVNEAFNNVSEAVKDADLLIAVSENDESNIIVCEMAKILFNVPNTQVLDFGSIEFFLLTWRY